MQISRRIQRLGFFAVASITLFYLVIVVFPERNALSPMTFSGTPPSEQLAPKRMTLQLDNVKGFFLQDLTATNDTTFNVFESPDFGLIPQIYTSVNKLPANATQWQHFETEIARMNQESLIEKFLVPGYKVLFLFRSAESFYHAGEKWYGEVAWRCQWTKHYGNGTTEWTDAKLTPGGIQGAMWIHDQWNKVMGKTGISKPQLYLSSPLSRAAETLLLAFNINRKPAPPTPPIFVEFLRDAYGIDTHSTRRDKDVLEKSFPLFQFEDDFNMTDPYWVSNQDEHRASIRHRAKIFLENLFLRRKEVYVAVSTHEAVIQHILAATGHRNFTVPMGHFIPIVIKASWQKTWSKRTEDEKYKKWFRKDRQCPAGDPVTDPEYENADTFFFDDFDYEGQ